MNIKKNKKKSVIKSLRSACTSKSLASLKPLSVLSLFAARAPGAESEFGDMVEEFKTGRQPYVVVVAGARVLYGELALAAAKAAGVETIEVQECPGCEGLNETDLGLKAAGLHLRGIRDRRRQDTFALRVTTTAVYNAWALAIKRRRPTRVPTSVKKEWEALRQRLIQEAFGRSQRSLIRDVNIQYLHAGLRDALRHGRLPARVIEAAARLDAKDQASLADQLDRGTSFANIENEFFGVGDGRRKTDFGAAKAIRASLHTLVSEARGREHCFGLRADEYQVAREASGMLNRWLAVPPPTQTIAEQIGMIGDYLKNRGVESGDDDTATDGGRGATGGQQ